MTDLTKKPRVKILSIEEALRLQGKEQKIKFLTIGEAMKKSEATQIDSQAKNNEGELETKKISHSIRGNYILMPKTNTYALGVHALREKCEQESNQNHPRFTRDNNSLIYRPLTFKENIEARVSGYNSTEDAEERKRLFSDWLDSCCGIAYKKGSTKFKIIPVCNELITIGKDFNEESLPIDYDSVSGAELDSSQGKYSHGLTNQGLTKPEVLNNEGWITAMEDDKALLNAYADIVFTELKKDKAMGFYVREKLETDELRHLYVSNLGVDSCADGSNNLYVNGCFLRVAHAKNFPQEIINFFKKFVISPNI